jgi:hypothetical protein
MKALPGGFNNRKFQGHRSGIAGGGIVSLYPSIHHPTSSADSIVPETPPIADAGEHLLEATLASGKV